MNRTSLAVIGYGHMSSRIYCPLLHTIADRVELAAIVEPDEQRRTAARATYNYAAAYETVEQLLDAARPQAAIVLAPAVHHYRVIAPLLAAGVDVYTEKPDTHHLAEARELVAAAKERDLIFQVGQNRLFMAVLAKTKSFLADTPVDFAAVEKSKTIRTTDPAYLLDDGLHVMSPLLWLAGEVAEVLSVVHVPDRLLSAHFLTVTGGAATLTMHLDSGYWVERFQLHGAAKSANVITPDGIELYEGGKLVEGPIVGRNPLLFNTGSLMGFEAAVSHFLDCVASREEPTGSARSLLRVHEIMNEVFTAAGLPRL